MSLLLDNRPLTSEERDITYRARIARDVLRIHRERQAGGRAGAERAPESSLDLARRFRPFSHAVPPFHETWYAAMDDPTLRRLLLLAPRESAKTSTVLTGVEWRLIQDRQTRIGIVSKTEGAAVAFLREIVRDFETNEALIAAVGRLKPEKPKLWTHNEIVIEGANLGKDVSAFALGVGGQVTGRRADVLVLDDVETLETVLTPAARSRTREWLAKEALPILSPDGEAWDVGTRKHEDDIHGWLAKEGSGWTVLDNCTRAILDDGSSYWPERWPLDVLEARKAELDAVDLRAWSSEYMNTIVPAATRMFDPMAWPTWTTLPPTCQLVQAWDPAISEKQTADWSAGACMAVDHEQNLYIVDGMTGHWAFNDLMDHIKTLGERWHPLQVGIEAIFHQIWAVQEALRRTMLPVVPLQTTGRVGGNLGTTAGMERAMNPALATLGQDKVSRARLLEARAAAGKVFRPAAVTPWWPEFAHQLAFFPSGTHDDCVDALSYCARLAAGISQRSGLQSSARATVPARGF